MDGKAKDLDAVARTYKIGGEDPGTEAGKLVSISGIDLQGTFELGQDDVAMGSHGSNDIVLEDPTVSRRHARIERSPDGYVIRDLDSTNGTYLNGVRIREAFLEHGAIIALGNARLQFVPLDEEFETPPAEETSFGDARGTSLEMRRIFTVLKKISPSDVTVTLEGETGTGKEVVARAIHASSRRTSGPLEVIDCGAVSRSLIESELFGHEKGAFTGALRSRAGVFERASRGTVLIDELGELDLDLQPRLLRVLERQEVKRVGGDRTITVDVRVIAATNRDLFSMVTDGSFREDLFYRISVVQLQLPPLRERRGDVALLARFFASELGRAYGHDRDVSVSPEAIEALEGYSWPGNVRELRNVLARALAMGDGDLIRPRDFILPSRRPFRPMDGDEALAGRTLEEIEKAAIRSTLKAQGGNKSATARALGIASSSLYEKLKRHGL
jgi:DNA-binding NtrC family response regulator